MNRAPQYTSVDQDVEGILRGAVIAPGLKRLAARVTRREAQAKKERRAKLSEKEAGAVSSLRKKTDLPIERRARFIRLVALDQAPDPMPGGYGKSPDSELVALIVLDQGLATWTPSEGWDLTEAGWTLLGTLLPGRRLAALRERRERVHEILLNDKPRPTDDATCRVCSRATWSGIAEVDPRRRYCALHGPKQLGRRRVRLPEIGQVFQRRCEG